MAPRQYAPTEKIFRTITLWLMWAIAAITVYFALYLDMNLWQQLQEDQSKITWIIIGLFVLGVAISLGLALSITNEAIRTAQLSGIARKSGLQGIETPHPDRAVERFFYSLKDIWNKNIQPDIEVLLDIEFSTFNRTSHAVEVIGNVLITLGLIGTVIGLTLTLSGLSSSLDALGQDQQQLINGLRRAMGGMGTAFYTTLLGSVLGGVLLRVFALITDHGIENLTDMIKKICIVYCVADLKPSLDRELRYLNSDVTLLGDNVRMLQDAMNESREAMANFRQEAVLLNKLSEDDQTNATLKDSVVLQHYYADLLREEIRVMNKLNRSWWGRLRKAMRQMRGS